MRTRRVYVAIVGSILVVAVALGSLNAPARLEDAIAPQAHWSPEAPGLNCDDACAAFTVLVAPSLRTLVSEGNALAELGRSRSRNVIELTIRMDRFRAATDQFSAILESQDVPSALTDEIDSIVRTIDSATAAMDASIAAIRAFDWDALAIQVDQFGSAMDALSSVAADLLA